MMNRRSILLITTLAVACCRANAQLVINELMQSNIDCIMDDINEFPDSWVELYNPTTTPIFLDEYKIGLTDNVNEAWQLPKETIGTNQFTLIYCDKEGNKKHTDFRLDSGKGGSVYLFHNGIVVDKVEKLNKQPAPNIAYGRKVDGSNTWGYQLTPTPKATNCGEICDYNHILGEPIFSEHGRVSTDKKSITLNLTVPAGSPEGTVIRYTVDGSEPTASSNEFRGSITFSSTRIIRAKLFCDGWLSPRSTTQSYIFFPRNLTLPVISINTNDKYLNDSKIGIYVDGSYKSGKKNYEFNWRRPIHFEYFEGENTESILNQLGEARIMGGATRGSGLKSLAVYAHKRFGTKRLKYEFFPDQKPGLTDFKSICLRNAGNDFDYLYMRDAIIQCSMSKHLDIDWQAWRPIIIYINGKYRGILNIRERSNDDNIYTNYDGLEDIDMFENWGELKAGDWENYNAFKIFYEEHGHTLEEYSKWLDWEEFLNVMAFNLYFNNVDFPGNNIVMWRPRTKDGRWRWIVKDTDFTLGLYGDSYNYKILKWLYNPSYDWNKNWGANSYEHTRLFRRLMEDADFSREFIDRSCIYMGDFMNEKGIREVWDPMYEKIKFEYPYHRELFNKWWPNYNEELSKARDWLSKRTNEYYNQIGDYYKLGTPVALTVNSQLSEEEQQAVAFRFNNITLSKGVFDGKFFVNHNITLEGIPSDENEVTGWDLIQVGTNGSVVNRHISGATCSLTMPSCQKLIIKAIIDRQSGISHLEALNWQWKTDGQQLYLSHVPLGTSIQLYNLQGILLQQTTAQQTGIRLPLNGNSQIYVLKVGSKTIKIKK